MSHQKSNNTHSHRITLFHTKNDRRKENATHKKKTQDSRRVLFEIEKEEPPRRREFEFENYYSVPMMVFSSVMEFGGLHAVGAVWRHTAA